MISGSQNLSNKAQELVVVVRKRLIWPADTIEHHPWPYLMSNPVKFSKYEFVNIIFHEF